MDTSEKRKEYRASVSKMGKKEFTLLKMQEFGFWPSNLPTPKERQSNETKEDYQKRKELLIEYGQLASQIANLYKEKEIISDELRKLRKQFSQTWDYDRIRKDVAQQIMQESIKRREERKKQKEIDKERVSSDWKKLRSENIVFIGKGYSGGLNHKETDEIKLLSLNLPIVKDDKELATLLEIDYKDLRNLAYHRDVVTQDHYYRYKIPKRSGGERSIAAPKPKLKKAQTMILQKILERIEISSSTHGFIKGKSIVTGAQTHVKHPKLLINIDLEDFFPTITFQRVRGMFRSFGYSGYVASILAMICTYCERMPIDVKMQTKFVKTTDRILPQGSPASPMITNIICRRLDQKLNEIASSDNIKYSRYADDMSFSFCDNLDDEQIKKILFSIQCAIYSEGFKLNKKKTRFLKPHNRQCVTGIVINNDQIGVPKTWVKRMRAALFNANKLLKSGKVPYETLSEISGMASWLKSVNCAKYKEIIDEAERIINYNKSS